MTTQRLAAAATRKTALNDLRRDYDSTLGQWLDDLNRAGQKPRNIEFSGKVEGKGGLHFAFTMRVTGRTSQTQIDDAKDLAIVLLHRLHSGQWLSEASLANASLTIDTSGATFSGGLPPISLPTTIPWENVGPGERRIKGYPDDSFVVRDEAHHVTRFLARKVRAG